MLVAERKREAVYDRSENLQQFGYSVESLKLVDVPLEEVGDAAPDEPAKRDYAAVGAVQDRLQFLSLAHVFTVEKVQQPEDEVLGNHRLHQEHVSSGVGNETLKDIID
mmetsp:Transcript_19352/g.77361  ORF Transcript_19352/g.77361 Transcript_19352/m.77361 type:complete len:108 (+) Transcript_19352:1178-1501(+)